VEEAGCEARPEVALLRTQRIRHDDRVTVAEEPEVGIRREWGRADLV
jgi:hypothetical protein